MKALLISAAMAVLFGGGAFAQTTDMTTPAPAQAAPAQADPMAAPTSTAPADANAAPSAAATPTATSQSMPMTASANATDSSAMVNPDPNYPICKTRGQDHCRVSSQMRHNR